MGENKMRDILIGLSKSSIESIFTVKKYSKEILEEDLERILFIRNLIEYEAEFIKVHCKEINIAQYVNELKKFALELFINQCVEAIPIEDKNKDDFDLKEHKDEGCDYFNYIYLNLEYPY